MDRAAVFPYSCLRIVCGMSVLAAALCLQGCETQPLKTPPEAVPNLPTRFRNDNADATAAASLDTWWKNLASADLDRLVEQALGGNRDLKIADIQIREAQARADQVHAGGKPTINVPLVTAVQAPGGTVGSVPVPGTSLTTQTSYQASLAGTYRVDLWGEQSTREQSADTQVLRARFERDNTRRNVIASVVELYVGWLSLHDSLRLAQDNIQASQRILGQIEQRYALGDATTGELEQQRAALYLQQANLPLLQQQQEDVRSQLALLTGVTTNEVQLPDSGLEALQLQGVAPGVPSTLLLRRPDIQAMEARLRAAHADIDVVRAQMLPTFDLTAQGGRSALSLMQLLSPQSLFWSTVASVTVRVFDGGRLDSQQAQAQAYYEEMVVTYGKLVYQALREVENSLFLMRATQQRYEAQAGATRSAQRMVETAQQAYDAGALDLTAVLDAQRNYQRQTDEWLRSKAEALKAYVSLARALG